MPLDLGLRNRTAQGLRNLWKALLPVFRVTRREVQDSLRDWRIVVPIVILVLGFPVLADFVAQRGLRFVSQYGANLVAERLFPFLILVVGFFPSTFALVIALESFVGEKERRSLEPLLTTPLSDVQLYLGKLLASTLVPVGASYLGIIASVVLLGVTVGWWPGFSMLLLAFALSAVQALVMVAAAVIVSSQSTSVRAANLLASFIIVPMALLLQVDAGLLLYGDERGLWLVTLALFVVSVLLVRLGTRLFSRERLLGEDLDELDLLSGSPARGGCASCLPAGPAPASQEPALRAASYGDRVDRRQLGSRGLVVGTFPASGGRPADGYIAGSEDLADAGLRRSRRWDCFRR